MKKMFFTAIALVVFSGASIANTIEERKEIESKKEILKSEKSATQNVATKNAIPDVCSRLYHSQVTFYLDCGASLDDAEFLANNGYEQCLCNVYGG